MYKRLNDLNKARGQLADALSKIPDGKDDSKINFPDDYYSLRQALEACAKCFDAISSDMSER